jgi:serine protease AprX
LGYDANATEIDNFVFKHPDMVILFAAGNEGMKLRVICHHKLITALGVDKRAPFGDTDPASIGSQAAAKNCITVGASESLRPNLKLDPTGIPFTWGNFM